MPPQDQAEHWMHAFVERAMRGPGVSEARSEPLEWTPIAGDGSMRRLFRVRRPGATAIAVLNPLAPDRAHPDENEAFLAVREHLAARGVRVPVVYAADLDRGLLLIEDLGDQRLLDACSSDLAEHLCLEAVDALVRMQAPVGPAFQPQAAGNPVYDEAFIRAQEAGYFLAEVARGLAGWDQPRIAVESDCGKLARQALDGPRVFMHRDFQSRNLMVLARPEPHLAVIDFQGARLGPAEYDLAALLFDPYGGLPPASHEALTAHYRERAHAAGVPGIPPPGAPVDEESRWRARFQANAANRLMQALGACAKLGVRFGRPGFREQIPAGLSRLEALLALKGDVPALLDLVRQVAGQIGRG